MIITSFQQGISAGKYLQNGFNNLTNCNIHSEPGNITANYALEKETDVNAPDETCILVGVKNGDVYALSKESGKIWKLSGGAWSLAHTNANVQHKGGLYHRGYLYYATSDKLGRYDLTSTWTDSYQTFANESEYKPMCISLQALRIGDGKYIASVDNSDTWSQEVLDLPDEYTITTIQNIETDLLIGTKSYGKPAKMFRWDNIEDSFFDDYEIGDEGANACFQIVGNTFIQHGSEGKFSYLRGGARLGNAKRIRGVTSQANFYNTTVHKGRGLFAIDDKIYSIYAMDDQQPLALNCEYTCSQAGATIHSILSTGNNLLVSWVKDSDKGIDQIGTDKATAIIETPIYLGKYKNMYAYYEEIPTGTSVSIATKQDNAGSWTDQAVKKDDQYNRRYQLFANIRNKSMAQFRITLNPNGGDAPTVNALQLVK